MGRIIYGNITGLHDEISYILKTFLKALRKFYKKLIKRRL